MIATLPSRSLRSFCFHARSRCSFLVSRSLHERVDVVALGNICLDIIVPVEPPIPERNRELLQRLIASPPSQEAWEVGGNCNFMIAAARLGLTVGSVGVIGDDVYGRFLDDVLQVDAL